MSKESQQRMLCSEARVNITQVVLFQKRSPKLNLAAGPLAEAPLIDDTRQYRLELRAKARRLKAQYGLKLIIGLFAYGVYKQVEASAGDFYYLPFAWEGKRLSSGNCFVRYQELSSNEMTIDHNWLIYVNQGNEQDADLRCSFTAMRFTIKMKT